MGLSWVLKHFLENSSLIIFCTDLWWTRAACLSIMNSATVLYLQEASLKPDLVQCSEMTSNVSDFWSEPLKAHLSKTVFREFITAALGGSQILPVS